MKTPIILTLALIAGAASVFAQASADESQYAVVSRDAHSRVWERTEYETRPDGTQFPHVHRVVETATGLNVWNSDTGQWEDSNPTIQQVPGGAVGIGAQHKVIFAANLATFGAIDMETPDGQRLQSHVLGLSYLDRQSGQSVLIAETTNCVGQIVSSNQVEYFDAFDGLSASVRYTYTRDSFEQDIILEENPAPPEEYGLNSSSTVLQVLTEFLSPPQPKVSMEFVSVAPGVQMEDQILRFKAMKIGHGRAFLMGNDTNGVPVTKQWLQLEGRQFLVEEVPVHQIKKELQNLPGPTASIKSGPVLNVVSSKRLLPSPPLAKTGTNEMRIAGNGKSTTGFVLDYITQNTSQTNYVFQSDTTYYISGNVSLFGANTTFEGGTVIKYASGVGLTVNTPVSWIAGSYRPVVMLSKDDNSAGENISGSTGTPGNSYYATKALCFDGAAANTNLTLQNLRIVNAQSGVVINGQSGHVLSDVQMVKCGNGFAVTNADFILCNALFDRVLTNFTGSSATGRVEHLTADTATWLNQNIGTNLFLTNCLLVAVTNLGNCTTQSVAVVSSSSGVFQSRGPGGYHYLATNSPYRHVGTTNISSAMLAALRLKSTYPPISYTNLTFTNGLTLSPQATRDTDTPDLGYHYDPIDYAFGGCSVSNTTFTAGTAVGWFRTASGYNHIGQGIHVSDQQTVWFNGTLENPTYWVRCNTSQEQDLTAGYNAGGMTSWASQYGSYSAAASVVANFLRVTGLAHTDNAFRDDYGFLIGRFNNSEFYGQGIGWYVSTYCFTNCLFRRCAVGDSQGSSGNEFHMRNCTFYGQGLTITPTTAIALSVKDSAFDRAYLSIGSLGANSSYAGYDYNSFTNGATRFPIGGSHDTNVIGSFNWQTSWLGNFYLPANSVLINAGSRTADLAGLYHFTTQVSQTKETNSIVDIGYHYVAVDASGNPIDSDGDGIPDYLEDTNGNGIFDTGDLDNWQIGTYSGLSSTNGLQVYTPLK